MLNGVSLVFPEVWKASHLQSAGNHHTGCVGSLAHQANIQGPKRDGKMGRCVDGVTFLAGFVGERMLQVLDVPEKTQLNHGENVQFFFLACQSAGPWFFLNIEFKYFMWLFEASTV